MSRIMYILGDSLQTLLATPAYVLRDVDKAVDDHRKHDTWQILTKKWFRSYSDFMVQGGWGETIFINMS
jgi:hypothetical protein